MPKYIELSSLLEKLQTTSIVTDDLYGMGIMSGMDAARKIVAEQPIIDAEPVVKKNSKIILVREPFLLDDELRKKVTEWVEWANTADPHEYDPFA